MRKQITVLAALAALLRLATTTTNPVYAKTTTKKVTRTIKIYKPGKYTQVKQTATLKKKGRKWTTSKWKSYKASSVSGYKSSTDNSLSSQSQLRQAAVNVVNSFRAKAGVKAV